MTQSTAMSTPATHGGRHRQLAGPAAFIVAAAIALPLTLAAGTLAPRLAVRGDIHYTYSGVAMTLSDLCVLIGVLVLATTSAVRDGWLKRIAYLLAIAGSAGIVVAEVLLRVKADTGDAVFGVVGPTQALGLIGVGIGIILSRVWRGWRRFAVLAMGLYIPAVLVPALALSSSKENLLALAGYHGLILVVGLAFWQEARAV